LEEYESDSEHYNQAILSFCGNIAAIDSSYVNRAVVHVSA